jgi:hypothetical protein
MTISDSQKPRHVSPAFRPQRAALWMGAVLVAGAFGCGSTTEDEPFADFEGVWSVDLDQSTLSCPQTKGLGNEGVIPFSPWTTSPLPSVKTGTVTIEAGILTDLVETHDLCSFNFNVAKTVARATVPSPDPYTGLPPGCTIPVGFVGETDIAPTPALNQFLGDSSRVVLTPGPEELSFELPAPEKGKAPIAQILGSATAALTLLDSNNILQALPPCTFSAQVKLHKIAKP